VQPPKRGSETVMSISASQLDLAADFPTPSAKQWRALVEKALKGADFEKHLVSYTADNIRFEPLYMQASEERLVTNGLPGQPWAICSRVDHPDPAAAGRLALADLEGGANLLSLVTADAGCARGYGVNLHSIEDLAHLCADVGLDMIGLRLEPSVNGKRNAALLAAFLGQSKVPASKLEVNFGLAPIAMLMRCGSLEVTGDTLMSDLAATVSDLRKCGFTGHLISCDVRPVHEAGGSEIQELAVALAMGVAYLRGLSQNGDELAVAARTLSWTVAVDSDQFMGLAKLRALRLLWMRVEQASGLPPQPIAIHCETAWRMMSRCDVPVNMLRTTMAAATACLGGADSICVLPFTAPQGLADAFARRLARNAQTVLAEEANLWRVADPAAGAGAYEALTDDLCHKAWALFQDIEAEGGIVESLQAGKLQPRIAALSAARAKKIASREIALTGTSEFPNLIEVPYEHVLDVAPAVTAPDHKPVGHQAATFADLMDQFKSGAHLAAVAPPPAAAMQIVALPSVRLSKPFEALREAAARHERTTGKRPYVFLANLGAPAEHTTRAIWVRNLLAAGGIDAPFNDGFTAAADIAKAYSHSEASVACICGSDDAYRKAAAEAADVLKQAGAKAVYVAGLPRGDDEKTLRKAGVDGFLFTGMDVLAELAEFQEKLDLR